LEQSILGVQRLAKILFVSGSIGLGHVIRDLAIVKEFRKLRPNVEIVWLAGEPAVSMLKGAGEKLLPEGSDYNKDTATATSTASEFNLSLAQHLFKSRSIWADAYKHYEKIVEREKPDLVVGDEAYEIAVTMANGRYVNMPKTLLIFDFIKSYPMSARPMERLVIWITNRYWHKVIHLPPLRQSLSVFVGEPEDIPDEKLGMFLSNAKETSKNMVFLGEILGFDPKDYMDEQRVRTQLNYGSEPLIIVSIGGTSVGRSLLDLCAKTYPLLKKDLPDLHMVLVGGPMLDSKSVTVPEGVEVRGYLPNLYQHFAAADLVVIQAGGASITELVALRKPFLYFPLESHFEQQIYVAGKAERHNAGIRMTYSQTTPERLAEVIKQNIAKKTNYKPIQIGGEKKMAELMCKVLEE
jgi:UDP-N-acetylglucosamine:LPS N-acetylglucosamine transferase